MSWHDLFDGSDHDLIPTLPNDVERYPGIGVEKMTTELEPLGELSDRVAKALGWSVDGVGLGDWADDELLPRFDPCNPLELLLLMCEYDVYPKLYSAEPDWFVAAGVNCRLSEAQFHKNDPASKQEAFIRCALLGILKKIEEGKS